MSGQLMLPTKAAKELLACILLNWELEEEDDAKTVLEWLDYSPIRATGFTGYWHSGHGLDWCLTCHTTFGYTISGRVRYGCPCCRHHPYTNGTYGSQGGLIDSLWLKYTGTSLGLEFLQLVEKYDNRRQPYEHSS